MKKLLNDVAKFQAASESPCHPSLSSALLSKDLSASRILLRMNLVAEEFMELCQAHGTTPEVLTGPHAADASMPHLADVEQIADAIGDMIYVLVGMSLEYGIPLDRVWDTIHESNMAKFPNGQILRRKSDGKVIKPDGWKPPAIRTALLQETEAEWHVGYPTKKRSL